MIVRTHQRVQIDDIHHAHLDARHVLLQQPGSGAGLDRGYIARARQNDVRLRSAIVRRKFPDRRSLRAVRQRFFKREPLQFRLFAAGNHVDVIPAAQAVIEYVQQTV